MKRTIATGVAAIIAATSTFAVPAYAGFGGTAAPVAAIAQAGNGVEQVRSRYYRPRPYYPRYRRHHNNNGAGVAAGIFGLAAGAIIGSAIANQGAQANDMDAYCFSKYRSYDPRSGTYLGNDGYRHPCR